VHGSVVDSSDEGCDDECFITKLSPNGALRIEPLLICVSDKLCAG